MASTYRPDTVRMTVKFIWAAGRRRRPTHARVILRRDASVRAAAPGRLCPRATGQHWRTAVNTPRSCDNRRRVLLFSRAAAPAIRRLELPIFATAAAGAARAGAARADSAAWCNCAAGRIAPRNRGAATGRRRATRGNCTAARRTGAGRSRCARASCDTAAGLWLGLRSAEVGAGDLSVCGAEGDAQTYCCKECRLAHWRPPLICHEAQTIGTGIGSELLP